ncbi:MAG: SRPBCC family protein [Gammaproteobacteria bacterium]|jgi:hypothetical protein
MDINPKAPAIASTEAFIQASLDVVWSVQTNLTEWSRWNPDVEYVDMEGALAPGTEFRWKAGGAAITSKLQEVEPKRRIVWTGKILGIRAVHVWMFEERADGILVRTEESFDGLLARLFAKSMRRTLALSLAKGLDALKLECERISSQKQQ